MPLINTTNEAYLLNEIRRIALGTKSELIAINCVEDHVHAAVSIPPSVSVAEWLRRVKGGSSHSMNQTDPSLGFRWQEGYGVLTFGEKNLPFVEAYIMNEKQHHRDKTLLSRLEATDD